VNEGRKGGVKFRKGRDRREGKLNRRTESGGLVTLENNFKTFGLFMQSQKKSDIKSLRNKSLRSDIVETI
jgi:hypothetical protein